MSDDRNTGAHPYSNVVAMVEQMLSEMNVRPMFVSRSPRSGEANSRRISPPPAKMTLFQPRLMKPTAVSDVIRGHLQPKGGAGGWSDAWSLARDRCSHA